MSSCPYQNIMNNFSFFGGKDKKVEDLSGKCPYSENKTKEELPKEKKEEPTEKKEEVSSDEDDKPRGGCPVMNKGKKKL